MLPDGCPQAPNPLPAWHARACKLQAGRRGLHEAAVPNALEGLVTCLPSAETPRKACERPLRAGPAKRNERHPSVATRESGFRRTLALSDHRPALCGPRARAADCPCLGELRRHNRTPCARDMARLQPKHTRAQPSGGTAPEAVALTTSWHNTAGKELGLIVSGAHQWKVHDGMQCLAHPCLPTCDETIEHPPSTIVMVGASTPDAKTLRESRHAT